MLTLDANAVGVTTWASQTNVPAGGIDASETATVRLPYASVPTTMFAKSPSHWTKPLWPELKLTPSSAVEVQPPPPG